jgi:hypothetical protein
MGWLPLTPPVPSSSGAAPLSPGICEGASITAVGGGQWQQHNQWEWSWERLEHPRGIGRCVQPPQLPAPSASVCVLLRPPLISLLRLLLRVVVPRVLGRRRSSCWDAGRAAAHAARCVAVAAVAEARRADSCLSRCCITVCVGGGRIGADGLAG